MRVKQRLRINAAVMVLSVIAVVAMLSVSTQRVVKAIKQDQIADKLMAAQFERLALRVDYLHTSSDRAREQVRAKNEQVGELLKAAAEKFDGPEEKKTIAALLEGHESIGKIFRAIVVNRRDTESKSRDAALSDEVEKRLLSQLNMRVYESVRLGGRLHESSEATVVAAFKTAGGWCVFIMMLVSAVVLINSMTMNRAIAARIGRLRDGAAIIGNGNLDHRIDIKGDDEFTELAGSFNEMTAKLGGSYHDLENEIDERKRTEDQLQETAVELLAANVELSDSRRAAIDLMEDALVARRAAEAAVAELRRSNEDLIRLNRAMVGRELRLIELKEEVNALRAQAGQPPRHASDAGERKS